MFGWTRALVTAFPVAIVATIQEWLDSGGYVDGSRVSDDLEVWKGGGKSACEVLRMLFFGWKNMRCRRSSIALTIPHAAVLGNGAAVPVFPYR